MAEASTTTPTTTLAETGGSADADPAEVNPLAETPPGDDPDKLGEAGKKALEAERGRAAEADKRARALQRELDALKRNALPDAERAAADAEARGRTAAQVEFGQQLARSEFATEAARINPGFTVDSIADDINWAKFVGPDGERDTHAIVAAAKRLVPKGEAIPPDFDGGSRTTTKTTDMNDLIRRAGRR